MLEVTTDPDTTIDQPPPVAPEPDAEPERRPKKETKGDSKPDRGDLEDRRSRPGLSKELQAVKDAENATLRDIVNALGTEGAYKIRVKRLEPQQFRDPVTRQMVATGGFLKDYQTPVDEEVLAQNHGGGQFQLQFLRRNAQGSFVHFTQRTISVVGDPRLDDTFRNVAPPGAPAAPAPVAAADNPHLVTKAFDILTDQLREKRTEDLRAHAPAPNPDVSPAMKQVLELMQRQIDAANEQTKELRAELARARDTKPAEDPIKERLLDSLMKDDSARLQATRAQYESEIRILKENHIADERRIRDQFERERSELKQAHQNEMNLTRQTHEIQLNAAKGMYETNMKLAEHENRRLDRENAELKADNKELRAKKEKGPLEIIQDAEKIKDAIGAGGDDGDKSGWEKAAELAPGLIEAAKGYFQPPPQQQPQPQQQAVQAQPKIMRGPDGQLYKLDAQGNLQPVKKKPKPPPQPGPNGEPPIPEIPADVIEKMVGYLERAFAGNQEPEVVAQSGRSMVPPEILGAIRDHGVDGFLSKVAKLPGTSPLATQAGRNWVRKVGKELVGE